MTTEDIPRNRYWYKIGQLWTVGIIIAMLIAAGLLWYAGEKAVRQQQNFNQSVVACVQAGGDAEECEESLSR